MSLSFVTRSNAGARLTEVANTAANGDQAGVRYTLALDDQRTEAVEKSGAKWQYGYDSLKQLVTAKKTDTQASVIPPLDQSYAYDPMGNRRTYADQVGSTAYTPNNANQHTAVGGVASVYDHNGNLLTDGVKNYTWDAENQLTSVTPVIPTEGSSKVVPSPKDDKTARPRRSGPYTYDWRMRRTGKKSYTYANGAWSLATTIDFKYHEWNPIRETITSVVSINAQPSTITSTKSYVWGNDLSGNLQGAGGVGGLLSMKYNGVDYFYAYDGNGNVRALVKADAANLESSGVTARYAYDGFGNEVAAIGTDADKNTFRFSTKQLDAETGMNYYGYRYYAAAAGRWINRDLIQENGGINIYTMVGNNTLSFWDLNGLLGINFGGGFGGVPVFYEPWPKPDSPTPLGFCLTYTCYPFDPTPKDPPRNQVEPRPNDPKPKVDAYKKFVSDCANATRVASSKCGKCEISIALKRSYSPIYKEIDCGGICQKK